MHVNDRPISLVMYEHYYRNSSPSKTPVAKLDVDVFAYIIRKSADKTNSLELNIRGVNVTADVELHKMQTLSSLMSSPPVLSIAAAFSVSEPKHQIEVVKQRIEAMRLKLNGLKGDLQKKVTELSLQLTAFPRVRYDEKKLFLAKEERFNCFSSCSGKKKKKCLVM